jgi:hypothetical protein
MVLVRSPYLKTLFCLHADAEQFQCSKSLLHNVVLSIKTIFDQVTVCQKGHPLVPLRRIKWFRDLFEKSISQTASSSRMVEGLLTGESISSGLAGGSKMPTRRFELASHACGDGPGVSWRESLRKSPTVVLLEKALQVSGEGDIGDQ